MTTIKINEINKGISYSVKDNSHRGIKTVSGSQVQPGDIVIIDNHGVEVIEDIRTADEITADIIAYFNDNEEDFNKCIEELDQYNGYLGDDRYYDMEELDEFYNGVEPSEILRRAFYGYDESYGIESSFNPNRDYFTYNGYGNLISSDYKDYSDKIDEYAIKEMLENRQYIDSIEESEKLAALFDELEEANI